MTQTNCSAKAPDCSQSPIFRPEEVQEMFGIKQRAYYNRIKYLKIEAYRDEEGKVYLDQEQVNLLEKLDEYVSITGKMEGFEPNNNGASLVKTESQQLETASGEKIEPTSEAKPRGEEISEFDYSVQSRAAEVLSAAGEALMADYLANPHKLAPEFRRKVFARSNGIPKLLDPMALVSQIATAAQGSYTGQEKESE